MKLTELFPENEFGEIFNFAGSELSGEPLHRIHEKRAGTAFLYV